MLVGGVTGPGGASENMLEVDADADDDDDEKGVPEKCDGGAATGSKDVVRGRGGPAPPPETGIGPGRGAYAE